MATHPAKYPELGWRVILLKAITDIQKVEKERSLCVSSLLSLHTHRVYLQQEVYIGDFNPLEPWVFTGYYCLGALQSKENQSGLKRLR